VLAALAWRNLWRRPQRTLLSLLAITLVCALLVFLRSFQDGVYGQMKETTLRIFDGYAQLQPPGYAEDPSLDRVISGPASLARQALALPGISAAAPRVNAFAILASGNRSYAAAVVGIDPDSERRITTLAARIASGGNLSAQDTDAAVLGDVLARNLGVQLGDRITLLGAGKDGSVAADALKVTGLYHSGLPDLDRSVLLMPLARAQETFGMEGQASTIALGGPSLAAVSRALPQLATLAAAHGVAVRDWQAMEPAMRDTIELKYAISLLFYATLVLVVAFIILNALLMSVLERSREMGTLLALGMRQEQIGALVWVELSLLAAGGVLAGVAVGAALSLWLRHTGIVYPIDPKLLAQLGVPERLRPMLSWKSALGGPGALLAMILVGGVVPYARIRRMNPTLAMRGA
jgi:ABC-type lipoprotein release transport system permease subunit